MKKRVLVASPVKQKEAILKEFLESLGNLHQENLLVDFVFIDDQNDHHLLEAFRLANPAVRIIKAESNNPYLRDEKTHHWREELIWRVADFKNKFIAMAYEEGYDYLFLVDSDLYLHPQTLVHLVSLQKDIVSEVFWTRWDPGFIPLPQVWLTDQYQLFHAPRGQKFSEQEVRRRTLEFLEMLSRPGTYKVGGLGACTLISRKSLALGVSFSELYNLHLWGEDRHFCIRAVALGLELYADTHFPPFHIYRESELAALKEYKGKVLMTGATTPGPQAPLNQEKEERGSRITLAMLVRNEVGRYLAKVLQQAREYINQAVILDDASEDHTVALCKDLLQGIPLIIKSNEASCFNNEISLRKQLWQMTIDTNPDWILILDADEIFEDHAPETLKELARTKEVCWYAFRLFDMWTENHFREDGYWYAHKTYRPFMVRYIPGFAYQWKQTPLHCGRFPVNIGDAPGKNHPLGVKHLGWMRPEDRLRKYYRYKELDPQGRYGIQEQYDSILDPCPRLVPWEAREK
ncbi:glycosyltransferase [Desulforamulus ruminis]|uniref:glycosyltransferase n=1 Tax=Desulforamulus ruminis TaxID=1564 RepID=UPI002FD8AF7E